MPTRKNQHWEGEKQKTVPTNVTNIAVYDSPDSLLDENGYLNDVFSENNYNADFVSRNTHSNTVPNTPDQRLITLALLRQGTTYSRDTTRFDFEVTVNNNRPIQDCVHPDDQTQPTFDMTPGFKPATLLILDRLIRNAE